MEAWDSRDTRLRDFSQEFSDYVKETQRLRAARSVHVASLQIYREETETTASTAITHAKGKKKEAKAAAARQRSPIGVSGSNPAGTIPA